MADAESQPPVRDSVPSDTVSYGGASATGASASGASATGASASGASATGASASGASATGASASASNGSVSHSQATPGSVAKASAPNGSLAGGGGAGGGGAGSGGARTRTTAANGRVVRGSGSRRDSDEIVADIERTRENLARTIDALADRVSPASNVRRLKERASAELAKPEVQLAAAAITLAMTGFVIYRIVRRRRS
jgi:hypothetical protein